MASAASVAPTINPSASNGPAPSTAQKDGMNRQNKQNTGAKMTEKARKESPSDANLRSATPKAWSGTNPITQRASTPNQAKGNLSHNKSTTSSKMTTSKDQALSDKHNYDRLRFLFGGTVGLQVVLTTKNGDKFEGLFAGYSGSPNNFKLTLKMTKRIPNTPITQPNGVTSWEAAFTGSSPDHALAFELKDMADMTVPEFSLPEISRQTNGVSGSFQTDADISGKTARGERFLQPWVPDTSDTADLSLDSTNALGWDQFATHEKMTGGHSTYHEELYTTSIDRNAADYKRREAQAAKIAREIESQTSTNTHLREERGQALESESGEDEEAKYSGVRRDQPNYLPLPTGSANRYTPPALRAPGAQATSPGAPVDPAIISSQMAGQAAARSSAKVESISGNQSRAVSMTQSNNDEPSALDKLAEISKLTANGSASKTFQPKQIPTASPRPNADTEVASQGVESKVLHQFRQFADSERARLAEKKRAQATQDRTAKINDLLRFSQTFTLKTPIPTDLVGILAKDPKKQEAIIEKAKQQAKPDATTPTSSASSSTTLPPVPKFDKSQIPPPIPERGTFNAGRGAANKQTLGRGARPLTQQLPFAAVPSAPRGQSIKNGQHPAPIPLPEIRSNAASNSGLSSPRGIDTPTSAVSSKFNVRAMEFRPTAPAFNPSNASVSAASPSPVAITPSVVRSASPSSFFGQRRPRPPAERLDVTKSFNPISRMKKEVQAKLAESSEEPKRDFAANGGIPNAYHTQPVWVVAEQNADKTYESAFVKAAPPMVSPAQSRTTSHGTLPFHPQMSHMGNPQLQHTQHGPPQFHPNYDDGHRMNYTNGANSTFQSPHATPRMTPSMMGHHQGPYAQNYFPNRGPMMQQYGPGMINAHHGQMGAPPMMIQQASSGGYMGMPGQYGMVQPSPTPGYVYPQHQNGGYTNLSRMAPPMMQQHSHQGYNQMYSSPGHAGMMHGQPQMGRGYMGHQTLYGTSPHQHPHMGQRAMSSGYGKGMPQNGVSPANAPQQPAAYGQMPVSEEAK